MNDTPFEDGPYLDRGIDLWKVFVILVALALLVAGALMWPVG